MAAYAPRLCNGHHHQSGNLTQILAGLVGPVMGRGGFDQTHNTSISL